MQGIIPTAKMYYIGLKVNPMYCIVKDRGNSPKPFWDLDLTTFDNAAYCGWNDLNVFCGHYNDKPKGMTWAEVLEGLAIGCHRFFPEPKSAYLYLRGNLRAYQRNQYNGSPNKLTKDDQLNVWKWVEDNTVIRTIEMDFIKMFHTAPTTDWSEAFPKKKSFV